MALKDWKKDKNLANYGWKHKINGLLWVESGLKGKGYIVQFWRTYYQMGSQTTILGRFKTKSQALKFAREYMRKH